MIDYSLLRIGQLTNSAAARSLADRIDAGLGVETVRYDGAIKESLKTAWNECDLLISHLALGATTRLIAPLLESKETDPGVVVVDEAGRFAIPLVGGHVGGANELARRVAPVIGATPVVTTATDVNNIPGLDTLGWHCDGDLAGVTRAILDGEQVRLTRTQTWPMPPLPSNVSEEAEDAVAQIFVTDQALVAEEISALREELTTVVLHPKSLIVGVGCKRGTSLDDLHVAVASAFADTGLSMASIKAIATAEIKADEDGLIDLADELGAEFLCLPAEQLAVVEVPNPSKHALNAVGTPSVSEASVIASGAELIVEKQKLDKVTVAVGRIPAVGTLKIVGLGPGARDLLTPRAREAITNAQVVVGYRPYIKQIRDLVRPGTEIVATGMGSEAKRTALAIAKAREGRSVVLVSSGDPGIYAMASPTLEQRTEGIDVAVIPGVTAELAASALVGAMLGHDHATISLSDLHTDWDVIEKRLQAAGEGDLVVALYNPRSHKRRMHLPRALEIIGAHRPPTTPIAVVKNAEREGQEITMATLADFDVDLVDMRSIVLIGSSTTTFVTSGRGRQLIVTPRDYHWMEEKKA